MSILYVVATPIGNLQDMSLRALATLKSVDTIACEDTRHSLKLLNRFEIRKPLVSCHGYNEEKSAARIVRLLAEGKTVAYVSDAGTPSLSDPGARLVARVKAEGFRGVPIPGASAFAALVSVAGFPDKTVTFEGFLSPKAGRRKSRLRELLDREEAFVVYESPHRVLKLLADLSDLDSERLVLVGREMTKEFEEFLEGTASELASELGKRDAVKGEVSVLVSGKKKS